MKIPRISCSLTVLVVWVLLILGCQSVREAAVVNLCQAPDSVFSSVLDRVASGSVPDVDNAIRSLSCLDGGNLEDTHIAIGEAAFHFSKKIAPVLESANVSSNDLIAMSVMLSSEYVDEPCKRRDEPCKRRDELAKRRISILEDPAFGFARSAVLQQLSSAIATQDRFCKDEGQP